MTIFLWNLFCIIVKKLQTNIVFKSFNKISTRRYSKVVYWIKNPLKGEIITTIMATNQKLFSLKPLSIWSSYPLHIFKTKKQTIIVQQFALLIKQHNQCNTIALLLPSWCIYHSRGAGEQLVDTKMAVWIWNFESLG